MWLKPFSKVRACLIPNPFSQHSAVIAVFGEEFAHTDKVPGEFHRFLLEAQEVRHDGDYGPRNAVRLEQTQERIRQAERFLQVAAQSIRSLSPEDANAE